MDNRNIAEHEGLRIKGRASFWSPAIRYDESDSSSRWSNAGGTMISAKTSLGATTMGAARGSDGLDPELGIGDGWLCVLLNASRVALIVLYMKHGIGLKDENLARTLRGLSLR